MKRTAHHIVRLTLALVAVALTTCVPAATAADYWASLASTRGEIAPGVNGFAVMSAGGPWNAGRSGCTADPGSYVAGAFCKFRFNVPAGLTAGAVANGGIARGTFRTANDYFVLRSERPGGNPAGVTDSTGDGNFNHGWQVLGSYVDIGLRVNTATTTTSTSNWLQIDTFDVVLHDPTIPAIQALQAGSGGWNGPACAPYSHTWSDAGSQVASLSVTDVSSGAMVDSWSAAAAAGVVSGHPTATDTGCLPAPGTGTYAFRAVATDRAGNRSTHDFTASFDVTPPAVGAPTLHDEAFANDTSVGSRDGYRPPVTWHNVADAHSGITSIAATLDGSPVPSTRSDGDVTLALTDPVSAGTHVVQLKVTDAVGNVTTNARTFTVRDDVAPTIDVASPGAEGGSEPVLDVTAHDDHAGIDPVTWTVKVNGVTLVTSSTTRRLQAQIGYLVDGHHTITVSIADHAGNTGTQSIDYAADSGDDIPDPPGLTGVFVFSAPNTVTEGRTYHVRALVIRDGRPITGRVELRAGALVLATHDVPANGAVDLAAMIDVPGPLVLVPPSGSGLDSVTLTYAFEPTPTPKPPTDPPAANPTSGAAAPAQAPSSGYPRNVVYYVGNVPHWNGVPLAESGAPLDKVAPTWKLTLVQQRRGVVRRNRRITARLWTSEMAVMSFSPAGSVTRTTISPRRQLRTLQIAIGPATALGRRIAATRAGTIVRVRIRVVATDKNENRSFPTWVTLRVRA